MPNPNGTRAPADVQLEIQPRGGRGINLHQMQDEGQRADQPMQRRQPLENAFANLGPMTQREARQLAETAKDHPPRTVDEAENLGASLVATMQNEDGGSQEQLPKYCLKVLVNVKEKLTEATRDALVNTPQLIATIVRQLGRNHELTELAIDSLVGLCGPRGSNRFTERAQSLTQHVGRLVDFLPSKPSSADCDTFLQDASIRSRIESVLYILAAITDDTVKTMHAAELMNKLCTLLYSKVQRDKESAEQLNMAIGAVLEQVLQQEDGQRSTSRVNQLYNIPGLVAITQSIAFHRPEQRQQDITPSQVIFRGLCDLIDPAREQYNQAQLEERGVPGGSLFAPHSELSNLVEKIRGFRHDKDGDRKARILILGSMGSGKSSLIHTLWYLLRNEQGADFGKGRPDIAQSLHSVDAQGQTTATGSKSCTRHLQYHSNPLAPGFEIGDCDGIGDLSSEAGMRTLLKFVLGAMPETPTQGEVQWGMKHDRPPTWGEWFRARLTGFRWAPSLDKRPEAIMLCTNDEEQIEEGDIGKIQKFFKRRLVQTAGRVADITKEMEAIARHGRPTEVPTPVRCVGEERAHSMCRVTSAAMQCDERREMMRAGVSDVYMVEPFRRDSRCKGNDLYEFGAQNAKEILQLFDDALEEAKQFRNNPPRPS
eukprot:m.226966 g.226966  ORF g.226966 m.226966 type:complete len:654 (-) comp18809_c1_seq6:2005-3966(-)